MHTEHHTHRIATIGPEMLVSLLESIGIDTFSATTPEEAVSHIQAISEKDMYAIMCVTETLARQLPEKLLQQLQKQSRPTLLLLPDLQSDNAQNIARIRELAKRATGSDILGEA